MRKNLKYLTTDFGVKSQQTNRKITTIAKASLIIPNKNLAKGWIKAELFLITQSPGYNGVKGLENNKNILNKVMEYRLENQPRNLDGRS